MLEGIAQGHKMGGALRQPNFLIVSKHSGKLFRLSVWSEAETKLIAEIIKETQYFDVKNHLWPKMRCKNHDLLL